MGIESRDWYRKDPPKGRPAAGPAPSTVARGGSMVSRLFWGGLAVAVVAGVAAWAVAGRSLPVPGIGGGGDPREVRVYLRDGTFKPAVYAGRACVTVDGQRRVCADYLKGDRPAERLRVALGSAGYRVVFVRE